jgi:hypothetical protein
LGVHDAPISVFTIDRFPQLRRDDMMLSPALVRDHRLHRASERSLITLRSGANEAQEKVGACHG